MIYVSCSRISQQKKLFMWHCRSFVDRFIIAFCCSLWTSCRRTGLQSSCAYSHRKLVVRLYASLWEGTPAMPSSSSTLSLQSGKATISTISLPSSAIPEFLVYNPASKLPTFFFLHRHMYTPFTLYAQSLLTMRICYDEFSQRTREQVYVTLVIKLLIFIIMKI